MSDRTAIPLSNGLSSIVRHQNMTLEHWVWVEGAVPQTVHAHDSWQVCEYLSHPGHYICRGSRDAVPARAFTLVAPGDAHAPFDAEVRLGARYRVWHFDRETLLSIERAAGHSVLTSRLPLVWTDPAVLASLQVLAGHFAESGEAAVNAELFFVRLLGIPASEWRGAQGAKAPHRSLERAREYLFAHRHRVVPLGELASVADLSVSRLAHGFKQRFHLSPSTFGLAIRTDRGRRLLSEGLTPAAAACEAGFSDQAHFTRCFRRLVGPTPSAYRRLIHGSRGIVPNVSAPDARHRGTLRADERASVADCIVDD